jgi:phosphatidylglycerol:prolipoprotein diacylglycerol transferase
MHVAADGYFMEYVRICTDPSQVFWDPWRVGLGYCRELGGLPRFDEAHRYLGCVLTERNCFGWINLFAGGYTWYGGLLGGALAGGFLIRRRHLPLWPMIDTLAWVGFLGLGIGRIGCFLNGCCFGRITDGVLGVSFPPGSPAWVEHGQRGLIGPAEAPLPVIPIQLFEAAAAFAIAGFLALFLARRKRYEGQLVVVGIALYAVARIVLELFRADPRGGLLGLSTSQWVGLFALAGVFLLHRRLGARAEAARPRTDPPSTDSPDGPAVAGEGDGERTKPPAAEPPPDRSDDAT